jgi:asparagine synthase (glutamine-hydrolysing)
MCGINGHLSKHLKLDNSLVQIMNDQMIFRGPDDQGMTLFKNLSLGMRRLSIIDVAGGHQPLEDEESILVFNGEIYNYKILRKELESRYTFKTQSDSEVLFLGLKSYGIDFIYRLKGMFGFAFFDKKNEQLILARDQLGVKPLYYFQNETEFIFSSNIDSIRSVKSNVPLDEHSLSEYFLTSFVSAPKTVFQDIYKLDAGTYLLVDAKSLNVNKVKYWDCSIASKLQSLSLEKLKKDFYHLFDQSVSNMLQSDVPLGIFLSGGIDSSLVVARAASILKAEKLNTFSVGFSRGNDELPLAFKVSQKFQTKHKEFVLDGKTSFEIFKSAIPFMDEPLIDNALIPTLFLSQKAREEGIKVILTGAGGDELFGGYPRYLGYRKWLNPLRYPKGIPFLSFFLRYSKSNKLSYLSDPFIYYCANLNNVNINYFKKFINNFSSESLGPFKKDFLSLMTKYSSKGLQKLDLNHYLQENVLMIADKMTMGASIEGRVPFLDSDLVEWAFSLPNDILYYNNELKGLLRYFAKDHLPNELFNSPKMGFSGPYISWVKEYWGGEIYLSLTDKLCSYYRKNCKTEMLNEIFDNFEVRQGFESTAYALYVFNEWCLYHIDGER